MLVEQEPTLASMPCWNVLKTGANVFIQNYVEVMRRQRPYMVQKEVKKSGPKHINIKMIKF